jgi:hypothetical protein
MTMHHEASISRRIPRKPGVQHKLSTDRSRSVTATPGGLLERLADCLGLGRNPEMPRPPKSERAFSTVRKGYCTNHVPDNLEQEDFSPEPPQARYSAVSEARRRAFLEELLAEPEPEYPPPPLSSIDALAAQQAMGKQSDFGVGIPPAA